MYKKKTNPKLKLK